MSGFGSKVLLRRLATVAALVLTASLTLAASPQQLPAELRPAHGDGQVRALIIGINNYERPNVVPTLEGAVPDALDLARTLSQLGVSDLRVLLDDQATKPNVTAELEKLIGRVARGDLVIITFAGHGFQDEERVSGSEADQMDENFILYGFNGGDGWTEQIPDDDMFGWLSKLESKGASIIFLADSCHGGGMVKGADRRAGPLRVRSIKRAATPADVAPGVFWRERVAGAKASVHHETTGAEKWAFDQAAMKALPHLTFIAAVDAKTEVPETFISSEATSRGAASYVLARALAGAADAAGNGDGITTRRELAGYVRQNVRELTLARQSPMVEPREEAAADFQVFRIVREAAAAAPQLLVADPPVPGDKTASSGSRSAAPRSEPAASAADISKRLIHDGHTGDVITPAGEVLAYGVAAEKLPPVLQRVDAFDRLARLAAQRPLDVALYPSQPVFTDRDKFRVSLKETYGSYLLIANLSGNGEFTYMFPHGNADPFIQDTLWELPLIAGPPFGADTLIVVLSKVRPTALELALSLHSGKTEPLAVVDAFERLIPAGAHLGLVTYQTRPMLPH